MHNVWFMSKITLIFWQPETVTDKAHNHPLSLRVLHKKWSRNFHVFCLPDLLRLLWELIFVFLICCGCYGDWADRMERVHVAFLIWSHGGNWFLPFWFAAAVMRIELIAWNECALPSWSDRMERLWCRTCGRNSYECFSCIEIKKNRMVTSTDDKKLAALICS